MVSYVSGTYRAFDDATPELSTKSNVESNSTMSTLIILPFSVSDNNIIPCGHSADSTLPWEIIITLEAALQHFYKELYKK